MTAPSGMPPRHDVAPVAVNMLEHALRYAKRGWPVFPCWERDETEAEYQARLSIMPEDKRADAKRWEAKNPRVAGGFNAATTEESKIRFWWKRWPDAAIGCPTGPALGAWVLDVDLPKAPGEPDGCDTLARLETDHGTLPATVTQRTGSGGDQRFFRWPADGPEIKNSQSKVGPKLDVRGVGGYVVMPPSMHPAGNRYAWTSNGAELAEAPSWLIELVLAKSAPVRPVERQTPTRAATGYGRAALDAEVGKVAVAPSGQRNGTLNAAAYSLGQLVAGRVLDQGEVESALLDAANTAGLTNGEARATIRSGMSAGGKEPRTAPEPGSPGEKPRAKGQGPHASQADEWEPDIRPWPSLSREAMPGIAGTFVELATRASEADPAAVLATFLTRFGAEVYGREPGKGPVLYVGETKHYPRLFTAIIGASSKARKGTSAGPVKVLFDFSAVPAALSSAYVSASTSNGPLSTGEGLAFAVRDARQEWVVDKKTKDGEWSTVDPGVEDKRLFVSDEEFAAALQCTKREGNTLSTAIRCFWDSGDYSPLVKRERTKTTGAHVCIVTHITTHELAALLDDVQAFNGFGNRFLWVCARRQREIPFPARMPEAELVAIRHNLFNVVALAHDCGVVTLDAHAREMWRGVYSDLSKDHPGLAGCIINRGEAQALRLALVYALLDGQAMIGEPHLRAGLAFWDFCKTSALYVFGGRESKPVADKILAALTDGPKTTTELHRVMGNNATKDKIKDALQSLMASGRIIQTEEKTASKPRKNYSLNEKYEVNEFSQGACSVAEPAREDNSDSSYNSSGGEKNSGLWTGPAEVAI